MSASRQKLRGLLLLWLIIGITSSLALSQKWLQEVENRAWDWRVRATAQASNHDAKIKIIMIDQPSIDYFAREEKIFWPWPRSLYNPALLFLQKSGARAVAFDLLFTENSNYVDDDGEFARTIAHSLPVVSATAFRNSEAGDATTRESLKQKQQLNNDLLSAFIDTAHAPSYTSATLPIPEILAASHSLGNVTGIPDSDAIFRRTWPGATAYGIATLNLPFALYAAAGGDRTIASNLRHVAEEDGSHLIRFHGPAGTYESFSMHAVIQSWIAVSEGREPPIPLETFKNSLVFIGTNAPGLLDLRPTPFRGSYSGVEFNATTLDNLLHQDFIREVSTSLALAAMLTVVSIALGSAFLASSTQIILAINALFLWVGGAFALASLGWWLPIVVPVGALITALSGSFYLQYTLEGRQRRFIKDAFKCYVSPDVIEQIIDNPGSLAIGGERRELTIFFSDIEGFTSISERLPPQQLVRLLNIFLSEVSGIILEHGGTIDKYVGDAVVAFWNAPLAVDDHPTKAVQAALACQQKLQELAKQFREDFGVSLKMRIGLHTAEVSVGNFGSNSRFNYTMVGDGANLCSRLEGVNKVFGTYIAASHTTKNATPTLSWRALGKVRVVGKDEVVSVFEPDAPLSAQEISMYERAIHLFEEGKREEAAALFGPLSNDPVSKKYLARIERERGTSLANSPVWNLTDK